MLRIVYSLLVTLAAPVAFAITAWRGIAAPAYRDRLSERFGFTRLRFAKPPLWVHAVSVGEVQAAAPLVRALAARYPGEPILVTTATPTGGERVRALFGETVRHAFLPYDTSGAVRRFLDRTQPRIAVVMETELWPNLFRACAQRRIPLVLASGRLSEKSVRRYRRVASLFRDALARDVIIAAQSDTDAARFREVGATRVTVTGSIKFDLEVPPASLAAGAELRAKQFAARRVWVAGSTHDGEEAQVLEAHEQVRSVHPDALLILVPRHPQRFDKVSAWLRSRGVEHARRSRGEAVNATTPVLLGDTLGELLAFYAASDVAFVGGSLVPIGGHSLLEPAALARPIVTGPYTFNARDIAQGFLTAQAAIEVTDSTSLGRVVSELMGDAPRRRELGERAARLVAANRGALGRVLELVAAALAADA
jgi:3-deoxy-D-manno-octulosonic-acid transferase